MAGEYLPKVEAKDYLDNQKEENDDSENTPPAGSPQVNQLLIFITTSDKTKTRTCFPTNDLIRGIFLVS